MSGRRPTTAEDKAREDAFAELMVSAARALGLTSNLMLTVLAHFTGRLAALTDRTVAEMMEAVQDGYDQALPDRRKNGSLAEREQRARRGQS